MKQQITYGLIGVVSMLLGIGGTVVLTQEQISVSYICSTTLDIAGFTKLSSTNATGYYTINGTQKSMICPKGKWIGLPDYIASQNKIIYTNVHGDYMCVPVGCKQLRKI